MHTYREKVSNRSKLSFQKLLISFQIHSYIIAVSTCHVPHDIDHIAEDKFVMHLPPM